MTSGASATRFLPTWGNDSYCLEWIDPHSGSIAEGLLAQAPVGLLHHSEPRLWRRNKAYCVPGDRKIQNWLTDLIYQKPGTSPLLQISLTTISVVEYCL